MKIIVTTAASTVSLQVVGVKIYKIFLEKPFGNNSVENRLAGHPVIMNQQLRVCTGKHN